jgi:quercetin dioxygenase-like cupin family protein
VFKVRGEQTDGSLTGFENLVASDDGPPLHTHPNEDETIQVLESEVRSKLGDEIQTGSAGSYVSIPRGTPHAWQIVSGAPARCSSTSRRRG